MRTYEVNANNNRSYTDVSAQAVGRVAAVWQRLGYEPKAYVCHGDPAKVREVPVTTARGTGAALVAEGRAQ